MDEVTRNSHQIEYHMDQLPTEEDLERQALRAAGITNRELEEAKRADEKIPDLKEYAPKNPRVIKHERLSQEDLLRRAEDEINDGMLFEDEFSDEKLHAEDEQFANPEVDVRPAGKMQRDERSKRGQHDRDERVRHEQRPHAVPDDRRAVRAQREQEKQVNRQERAVRDRQRSMDAREKDLRRRERELARREQELRDETEHTSRKSRDHRRNGRDRRDNDRPRKKHHPIRNFFVFVLIIILLLAGWFAYKLNSMIEGGLSTSDLESLISEEVKSSTSGGAMAGYTNIALFGVDSRDGNLGAGNNRSDIMIIASINKTSGDIKLVSVYRDTYLDIGNANYQKANAAFAFGGPEQAVQMMNTNLDMNITDYVVTGFTGIAKVIDAVGGIEIDVQEEEIQHINNYQLTMAEETGLTRVEVTAAGPQTLTGLQAVAYSRIRYTEGGDFKRTERQKEVITKTFEKLKTAGPFTMLSVANAVMSDVKTSLNMTEIAALAVKAMTYHIADTNGFPNEAMRTVGYIGDQSCVIPIRLADNVEWLHQYLFDDQSYTVSSTVQAISDHVSQVSGY